MLPCSSYIGLTVSFTFSCDLVLRLSLITMLPCSSYIGLTVSFTSSCDLVLKLSLITMLSLFILHWSSFTCDLVLRLSLITLLPCSSYIGVTVSFTLVVI